MADPVFKVLLAQPSWVITGFVSSTMGQSVNSLQYVRFVVSATVNGNASYNPTSDTVNFAFLDQMSHTAGTAPLVGDWKAGSWETDTITGQTAYVAVCLVGPGGTFVPAANTNYWIWMKVTDNPEIPVMMVGKLSIT